MKIYIVKQSYQDWDGGNAWILAVFKHKQDAEIYKGSLDALRDKVIENYKEYKNWTDMADTREAFIFGVRYNTAYCTSFDIQKMDVIE